MVRQSGKGFVDNFNSEIRNKWYIVVKESISGDLKGEKTPDMNSLQILLYPLCIRKSRKSRPIYNIVYKMEKSKVKD